MEIKDLNDIIAKQFQASPFEFSEPEKINHEMMQALAEAWSKEGFRKYMQNAINKLILSSAVRSETLVDMASRKGGILFLKQLMQVCESCFHDYNKLKGLKKWYGIKIRQEEVRTSPHESGEVAREKGNSRVQIRDEERSTDWLHESENEERYNHKFRLIIKNKAMKKVAKKAVKKSVKAIPAKKGAKRK